MAESSQYWSGIAYNDDQFSDNWALLHTYDRTVQGVIGTALAAYSGELEVTPSGGANVTMANGAALVDGKIYRNTANIVFTCVAPGAGSNYYTILLRKTWASEDVLATFLGPSAVAPPAITQTDGVVWDLQIATVEITNLGVITITDTREFVNAGRIRSFLVPAVNGYDLTAGALLVYINNVGYELPDAAGCSVFGKFYCPEDFLSDITVTPVVYQNAIAAGDIYAQTVCGYGAIGETPTNHTDNVGYTAMSVTQTLQTELTAIQMTLANLAKGDIVNVSMTRDATNILDTINGPVNFMGWLVSYKADS